MSLNNKHFELEKDLCIPQLWTCTLQFIIWLKPCICAERSISIDVCFEMQERRRTKVFHFAFSFPSWFSNRSSAHGFPMQLPVFCNCTFSFIFTTSIKNDNATFNLKLLPTDVGRTKWMVNSFITSSQTIRSDRQFCLTGWKVLPQRVWSLNNMSSQIQL